MAEKKYIDFPAGTYDSSKIFLQADAVTGELEKVNLPVIPTGATGIILLNMDSSPAATASNVKGFEAYTFSVDDYGTGYWVLNWSTGPTFLVENYFISFYSPSGVDMQIYANGVGGNTLELKTFASNSPAYLDASFYLLFIPLT